MTFSRRDFLKAAGAATGLGVLPPSFAKAQEPKIFPLRSSAFRQEIRPGVATEVWGFNESVPGPLLRMKKGERVRLPVHNDLEDATTVHWHGLRVPNEMDGVPYVTQLPIPKRNIFTYEFTTLDSGTFWYHPHQASFEQVARGMYGPLIVEEDKPIEVDREVIWVLSDFKLRRDGSQEDDFGALRDLANDGRLGNVICVNGKAVDAESALQVRSGERIRLRLINASSARVFSLRFSGHKPVVIAYDGQAVPPHEAPRGELVLGPGMRTDAVLDCMGKPGERHAVTSKWRETLALPSLVYGDDKPLRDKPLGAPVALEPNEIPEPDLAKAERHEIVFHGGMAGPPVIGKVDGKELNILEMLSKYGLAWTLNRSSAHEQALTHTPFLFLKKGRHYVLSMVNQTAFNHPMHLHGYMFRVVKHAGVVPRYQEWRDTVMMGPHESMDIAFVADNPGDWMFHCHILEHAASGMMGTIRVD